MKGLHYNTSIEVNATPQLVFNLINNIPGWWTTVFEGAATNEGDVFTVRFGETFITIGIIELIPAQKIHWQVVDCYKHWLRDKQEWKDTEMTWEIKAGEQSTQIHFTHIGLVPGIECYGGCEKAWNFYINESLYKYISEGKGMPEFK